MVREILVRLKDVDDLFRCAKTCRQWSCLVADVRRRRWPDRRSLFLSGFFIRKSSAKSFFPRRRSVFGPDPCRLGSFFPDAATRGLLKRATPLAARHGLLLVRLPSSGAWLHLAVCNLLAGTCDVLPPLVCRWTYRNSGYAIFTSADSSSIGEQQTSSPGYSALFKVLDICSLRCGQPYYLHTFSYHEARWKWNKPTEMVPDPTKTGFCPPLMHPNAVICHGNAHWLVGWNFDRPWASSLRTIDVHVETCHVSLTKIVSPVQYSSYQYDEPHLSVAADGALSLIFMERPGNNSQRFEIAIYTRQDGPRSEDGGPLGWLRSRVIELKPPNQIQAERMHLTFLGEKGGTLVIRDNYMNLYAADLESGDMEKLMYRGRVSQRMFIPFDIYWP
ncbi:hypothetical protein VPH35_126891 [Triticum aestivum]